MDSRSRNTLEKKQAKSAGRLYRAETHFILNNVSFQKTLLEFYINLEFSRTRNELQSTIDLFCI